MGLPMPVAGPGGQIVDSMRGMNALKKEMLINKYYGPNIQSEIDQRKALTQGHNIENQYMPDKLKLANALAELQNKFYGQNAQSQIDSRNALTNKYNTMLPLESKELELKNELYRDVTKADIAYKKAMGNYKNSGGAGMGAGQKELKGLENQISIEHPDWSPQQTNQVASAYLSGDDSLPDGTPVPPISGFVRTFLDEIAKRKSTAQGINQQRFAATTDALLKRGEKLLPSVVKYAGSLGKAQGNIDSIKSSLGTDTPDYNDYIYFTRTFVPTAAGEMMRALGVNASDTQKHIYQQVINPLAWDQNPKGAMANYKRMQEMFENTVSKTVGKSISEIKTGLGKTSRQKTPTKDGEPDFKNMTDDELRAYGNK